MTYPVRLAVQLAPQHTPWPVMHAAVAALEAMGVDIALTWDHFFPLSGDRDGMHFEAWTTLAAWAEQTRTIQLGPLVTATAYRNADLLADMARTVDHISAHEGTAGRLVLGIGSGWAERDFIEYGYEFGTVGGRLEQMTAALATVTDRWAQLNPPPTRAIPILIGGGGERRTLPAVARYADIWHSFSDAETLEHKLGVLAEHCRRIGRDISEIEISTGLPVDRLRSGDDELFWAHRALGASIYTLELHGPDYDFGAVEQALRWRDRANAG